MLIEINEKILLHTYPPLGQMFSTLNRRSKRGRGGEEKGMDGGKGVKAEGEGLSGAYLFHSFVRRRASIRTN